MPSRSTFGALHARFGRHTGHKGNEQPLSAGSNWPTNHGNAARGRPLSESMYGWTPSAHHSCVLFQDRPIARELEHIAAVHFGNLADGLQGVLDAGMDLRQDRG